MKEDKLQLALAMKVLADSKPTKTSLSDITCRIIVLMCRRATLVNIENKVELAEVLQISKSNQERGETTINLDILRVFLKKMECLSMRSKRTKIPSKQPLPCIMPWY